MKGFWIIFAAGTVFFLFFTWTISIRDKRFHGYPRFFAFESVFVLVLLNAQVWFRAPFSVRQICSWLFLLASIAAAAAGFGALRKYGKPDGSFENTTRVVERGIFKFIRHPMYASLLYLGTGAFLKDIRPVTVAVFLVNVAASVLTALMEEREMKVKFGPAYAAYRAKTKRFIPFVL